MSIIKLQNNSQIKREHFESAFSYFVIESIIEGNTHAEVFVEDIENPQLTIVWDGRYSIYCGGSADKTTLLEVIEFIKKEILTEDVRQDRGILKIMYESQMWKEALLESMQEINHSIYPRSIYKHELDNISSLPCRDSSILIKRIDDEILDNANLQNHMSLLEEIKQMWGTVGEFRSKGLGFCALWSDGIAAWCTGEYFSKNWCGIGIETDEEFQRKGIATEVTIEFLKHCKALNILPHWDCWKNNIPSVKTAEKTGFTKLSDYEIIFLRFV